jgi:hypothetical protein
MDEGIDNGHINEMWTIIGPFDHWSVSWVSLGAGGGGTGATLISAAGNDDSWS